MSDLDARRRFFADEVQITANLQSDALVQALASVPREHFLPQGPWTVWGEAGFTSGFRPTIDDDPKHVYHNVAIAIDPARTLFNGAPGAIGMAIDALALSPGQRVLHVGTGLGYYTAIIASCLGSTGRVVGIEIDAALAESARDRLGAMPWVAVGQGDGTGSLDGPFDAMLINAGVTHFPAAWLDALAPGGRLVLPLTATMPGMGTIGKGLMLLVTRTDEGVWPVRVLSFVSIYSALGLRDEALNARVGLALQKNPFPPLQRLRRDAHDVSPTCWLHVPGACLSLGER